MSPLRHSLEELSTDAFFYLKGDVSENLRSSSELLKALHLIGRNPASNNLMNYWNLFGHSGKVSFADFLKIAELETDFDVSRLIKIFVRMGGNSSGTTDRNRLKSNLRGGFLSNGDVDRLLELYRTEDGAGVNYLRLCKDVFSLSRMTPQSDGRKDKVDSRTFTRRKFSPKKQRVVESGGCIFLNTDGTFSSHEFDIELTEDANVRLLIQSTFNRSCDVEMLLFNAKSGERQTLVTGIQPAEQRAINSMDCSLAAGHYSLVPFTSGCHLHPCANQTHPSQLIRDNNHQTGTPRFRRALRELFDCLDLDGNGSLNQQEFTIFCFWTCGEAPSDEEWQLVKSNFSCRLGELTLEGFIDLQLAQLEQNADGPDEVWAMMRKSGFNGDLQMDQAVPFRVKCVFEKGEVTLQPRQISKTGELVERTLCRMAVDQAGHSRRIKNLNDLTLHTLDLPHRSTIVVRNKSHSTVLIRFDCTSSVNCLSSRGAMDFTMEIPARSSFLVVHLLPADLELDFVPVCRETLIR